MSVLGVNRAYRLAVLENAHQRPVHVVVVFSQAVFFDEAFSRQLGKILASVFGSDQAILLTLKEFERFQALIQGLNRAF